MTTRKYRMYTHAIYTHVFKNKRAQTHFEERAKEEEEEEENKEEELCFDSFDKICNSRLLGH